MLVQDVMHKVISNFSLYGYKIKYISENNNCRYRAYIIFSNFAVGLFAFLVSTNKILKVNSIDEIKERFKNINFFDDDCEIYKELTEIIEDTVLEDIHRILKIETDLEIKIIDYFCNLSSFISIIYESINVTDNDIFLAEDIRNIKYISNLEKNIMDMLTKKDKYITLNVISENTTLNLDEYNNISVKYVNVSEYNQTLEKLSGIKLL